LNELGTFADLFTRADFLFGAIAGTFVLLAGLLLRPGRGVAVWGLAVTIPTVAGIWLRVDHSGILVIGVGLLAVGGWLSTRSGSSKLLNVPIPALLVIAAGCLVLSRGVPANSSWWLPVVMPVAIALAGFQVRAWRDSPISLHLGLVFLVTTVGIWLTVPETSGARVLLGTALPLAWATYAPISARISAAGAFALTGLTVWVGVTGGATRPGSIIGAWACFGLLVLGPLLRSKLLGLPVSLLLTGHVAWVVVSARVFGFFRSAASAVVGVVAMTVLLLAVLYAVPEERLRSVVHRPD
jgi:hypothetical protein